MTRSNGRASRDAEAARRRPRATPRNADGAALRARRLRAIARRLSRSHARMRALVARIGPPNVLVTPDPFIALTGSIIHQQISMSAARSVRRRLSDRCPRGRWTPGAILALDDGELRACGLSRQKVGYVRNIAQAFAGGAVRRASLRRMADEAVIETVTRIKGVGRWTAEMLLIFSLEREDVWPVGDLGLRRAIQLFFELPAAPSPVQALSAGEIFRPVRSYATWYLWRSLEAPVAPGIA